MAEPAAWGEYLQLRALQRGGAASAYVVGGLLMIGRGKKTAVSETAATGGLESKTGLLKDTRVRHPGEKGKAGPCARDDKLRIADEWGRPREAPKTEPEALRSWITGGLLLD